MSRRLVTSLDLSRREVLQGAAATALSLGALGCSGGGAEGGPLQVGGLPVTCNLTLPVACVARAQANSAAPPGAPRFEFEYSKYSGWPEIKESLMAGPHPGRPTCWRRW